MSLAVHGPKSKSESVAQGLFWWVRCKAVAHTRPAFPQNAYGPVDIPLIRGPRRQATHLVFWKPGLKGLSSEGFWLLAGLSWLLSTWDAPLSEWQRGQVIFCTYYACLYLCVVPTIKQLFTVPWFGGKPEKYHPHCLFWLVINQIFAPLTTSKIFKNIIPW